MSTSIQALKAEHQNKVNKLLNDCGVFWAFNEQQYEEGKAKNPLAEGDKYVRIEGGGIVAASKVGQLVNGFKEIKKWFKEQTNNKKVREKNIEYELANHEAYYTNDISETLEHLGEGYTAEEVWSVFNKTKKKHQSNL